MKNSSTSWKSAFAIYAQPKVLGMIVLGISAGLPFGLISTTLSAWLADEHVSLAVIGYFSLVGVAYSIKVLWSPVIDHLPLPLLQCLFGKRRSWMLLAQSGIVAGLLLMGNADLEQDLQWVALLAVWVAFCSATQDIVIDAYRIEAVALELQGAMAAAYVFGYRLALLIAGAGALYLAEFFGWKTAYQVLSATMFLGIVATLCLAEPVAQDDEGTQVLEKQLEVALGLGKITSFTARIGKWFVDAVVSPFVEFFQRNGKAALTILVLIAVYKISDITMGVMANPFYLSLGFSKKDIADVTKLFGFVMTIVGTSFGGVLVAKLGIMRPLLLGAVLSSASNLLFAILAVSEPSLILLATVISADNLSGGIASAAFIAYLSGLTNKSYTATQYALFSSLMTLPAKLIGGFSGDLATSLGYQQFFIYSAALGLPAIMLVFKTMNLAKKAERQAD